MIDVDYIEVEGLLYPDIQIDDANVYDDFGKYGKLAQHCAEVEQFAFEMAERIRGQYLEKHPAP